MLFFHVSLQHLPFDTQLGELPETGLCIQRPCIQSSQFSELAKNHASLVTEKSNLEDP